MKMEDSKLEGLESGRTRKNSEVEGLERTPKWDDSIKEGTVIPAIVCAEYACVRHTTWCILQLLEKNLRYTIIAFYGHLQHHRPVNIINIIVLSTSSTFFHQYHGKSPSFDITILSASFRSCIFSETSSFYQCWQLC